MAKRKWDRWVAQQTYERWWLNKLVYFEWESPKTAKRVIKIEVNGPPSFVYGDAELTFEDGSRRFVPVDIDAYRPKKSELIVIEETHETPG